MPERPGESSAYEACGAMGFDMPCARPKGHSGKHRGYHQRGRKEPSTVWWWEPVPGVQT